MNIEDLRTHCLNKKGVTEDVKWEVNLCFMIAEKIFVLASVDAIPTRMSVKVAPEDFEELAARDGFKQAPYLARGQWVQIEDIEMLDDEECRTLLDNSYQIIKNKLTKKKQAEIDSL